MPVSDEHALRQFEIEALRQITDNLRRLNDKSEEQSKVLHSIDSRLIRIESNKLEPAVEELIVKVDALERDKHRRDGAISAWEWVFKNWPGIIGFFGLIVLILGLTGKLKL